MDHITIGTAGHIDHGKSQLVYALCGTDPDRLPAEKERGITLDLGYGHFQPHSSFVCSLVDVPGHEALVHNMLAGAQGFSGVLLVVACDEGLMPQTLEHFRLCQALKIPKGIVVLTKTDLVDPDWVDLMKLEMAEYFKVGFLKDAPIVAVSSKTGEGIDVLKKVIAQVFLRQSMPQGRFRLPIDRAFTKKGMGTIITGTVVSGQAEVADPLWLYPKKKTIRVRGFQSLGSDTSRLSQGMRGAINLIGVELDQIDRGMQIAAANSLVNSTKIGVFLEPIEGMAPYLVARKLVKVYGHASFALGRIIPLGPFEPWRGSVYCMLKLDREMSLGFKDALILRGNSPEQSLAGVQVLALQGPLNRRYRADLADGLEKLHHGSLAEQIGVSVLFAGSGGVKRDELVVFLGVKPKEVQISLAGLLAEQIVIEVDKVEHRLIHPRWAKGLVQFFQRTLSSFHQKFPDQLGAPVEYFLGKTKNNYTQAQISGLLAWASKQNLLAKTDKFYHLKGFKGALSKAQTELRQRILVQLAASAPKCPGLSVLSVQLQVSQDELLYLLKHLEKQGELVQVAVDLFYLTGDIAVLWSALESFLRDQRTITVIQYKQLAGVARKHAISLLEYFDQSHRTLRCGDTRSLRYEG